MAYRPPFRTESMPGHPPPKLPWKPPTPGKTGQLSSDLTPLERMELLTQRQNELTETIETLQAEIQHLQNLVKLLLGEDDDT